MNPLLIAAACAAMVASGGCKKAPKPADKQQPDQPQAVGPRQPGPPAPATAQVSAKDMEDVRIFIDNASGATGRMPSPKMTTDALKESGSPAADLVAKGLIVLPAARSRDDVWAYEAKAPEQGGYVVGANGVEQLGAAEAKRRLGK